MTTTAVLIAEARKLDAEATAGPWTTTDPTTWRYVPLVKTPEGGSFYVPNGSELTDVERQRMAVFIARSRTLVPQLADALAAADAESVSYKAWAGKLLARLTIAEARLAKVRERAIFYHSPDNLGRSYECRLCGGQGIGPALHDWSPSAPIDITHAPDCSACPMEDA